MRRVHRRRSCTSAQLFANPYVIEAPPYQRSFAWTPSRRPASCWRTSPRRWTRPRPAATGDYFLGTMLFIDRDGRAAGVARWPLAAPRRPHARGGRRPPAADDAHHPVLRPARPRRRCGPAPTPRLLARDRRRAGRASRAAADAREPDEAFFRDARARARRHPPRRRAASGLSAAEKRIIEVRDHLRAALARLRPRRAPPARRLPARPVLRGAGRDHRHRPRAPHVHGAQCDGQAAGAQRHPQGRPARQRAAGQARRLRAAIWDEAETRAGRRLREPVQPHPRHVRPARRPGDLRHHARSPSERAGRRPSSRSVLRPAARILDDIRNARHSGAAAFGRHQPLSALSRLALVRRLDTAGHAVVARAAARMRTGSRGSSASSIVWPSACASWASAAPSARAASARW